MNVQLSQMNLLLAWLWICLGFLSGMLLGLFFHRENWLGGYGSLKRRMYRLGPMPVTAAQYQSPIGTACRLEPVERRDQSNMILGRMLQPRHIKQEVTLQAKSPGDHRLGSLPVPGKEPLVLNAIVNDADPVA